MQAVKSKAGRNIRCLSSGRAKPWACGVDAFLLTLSPLRLSVNALAICSSMVLPREIGVNGRSIGAMSLGAGIRRALPLRIE
jgi:hypothetical protein